MSSDEVPCELVVTGSIQGQPDRWDELVALCLEHVQRSRKEPGCVSHDVFTAIDDRHRLFFFERWANKAALDAHFRRAESIAFVEQITSLATEPPTLRIDRIV